MPRRRYQGSSDVAIPVDEIMDVYGEYLDQILKKCSRFAVAEISKNAKKFYKPDVSGNLNPKWWDNTGNLAESIKSKRSRYNRKQCVAGASAPHAHLLEYGHAKYLWGKETGEHVPGSPFVRPAEQALLENLDAIIQSVLSGKRLVIGKR